MFAIAIAALCTLQTPQTINARFAPTRMAQALKLLSTATGRTLKAADAFNDEVMLARLTDAPVDATLRHIAEVYCAKWETQPDGSLLLADSAEARRNLENKEAAEGKVHVDNSLTYVRKRLSEQPAELDDAAVAKYKAEKALEDARRKAAEDSNNYDQMFLASSAEEETPAWRAAARLALSMGSEYFLDLPHNARDVWAEKPTHMQREFTDPAREILAQYRRELAIFNPAAQVDRVEFVALKWETGSSASVDVYGLDHAGKRVDKCGVRLADDSQILKTPGGHSKIASPKTGERPIQLPDDVLQMRTALSMEAHDPKRPEYFAKRRPKLLEPEKYEPAYSSEGQELLLAADATDRNLIGAVNDLCGDRFWEPKKLTPSQVLSIHAADLLPTSDNWLVVRSNERLYRASRREAGDFIRHSVEQGGVSLDDAAAWAARSTDNWVFIEWVGDYLDALVTPGGATNSGDDTLRFWSALGPSGRARLRRGEVMRLGELEPEAKTILSHFVFWRNEIKSGDAEPSDRLPNGITDGTLSMTVSEAPVLETWSSKVGPRIGAYPLSPEQFGKNLATGNEYAEVQASDYRVRNQFRVGVRRTYTLHYNFLPEGVTMEDELYEQFFDPHAAPLDRLPDALQAQVDKARREEMAKPRPKTTGTEAPPP